MEPIVAVRLQVVIRVMSSVEPVCCFEQSYWAEEVCSCLWISVLLSKLSKQATR